MSTVYPCVYRERVSVLPNGYTPRQVYPCVYREHSCHTLPQPVRGGLSLCIQGTLPPRRNCQSVIRFIPVHTGNTVFASSFICLVTVYPCAYREHFCNRYRSVAAPGLSLCIQGTRSVVVLPNRNRRFIPVHTGNTQ